MCTIKVSEEKLKSGYKIVYYNSYIFGGIIQEPDGRFCPTNDLIKVSSKKITIDETQEQDNIHKPNATFYKTDEAIIEYVEAKGGIKPLPRRDHSSVMIKNNECLLIYGGKNESAFQYKEQVNIKT